MNRRVVYLDARELASREKDAAVTFSYRGQLRSLRMPGDIWYKLRFASDEEIGTLMEEGRRLGISRDWWPGSWASIFHDAWGRPRSAPHTIRSVLPSHVVGGWEEARFRGIYQERVREYDIVSAYGWAGFRPLPVIRSAELVRRWAGPGMYLVRIRRVGGVLLPPHLRKDRLHWVTSEEIDELELGVDVVRGMVFRHWWNPSERIGRIMAGVTNWKRVLRSYWGSWAAPYGPTCHSAATGRTWTLANVVFDPAAAHYIVSRVRNRIAKVARRALHIYVDAVVTPEVLPVGEEIGSWKAKNQFSRISVQRPGGWIALDGAGETVRKSAGHRREA